MSDDIIREPERVNPETRAAFRRQVWLEVYLPLLLGAALVLGLVVLLMRAGLGGNSAWADAVTVFLLLPLIGLGLALLVFLAAAIFGVSWLIHRLPRGTSEVQWKARRLAGTADRAGRLAAAPIIRLRAARAALGRLGRRLRRAARRTEAGDHDA